MRPFLKTSSEISLDSALQFLDNDDALFSCVLNMSQGFDRGLPHRNELQDNPDIAQFLREVLASNRSEDAWQSNSSLNACYRRGWLQAELTAEERTVYVFPTMIHRR